MPEGPKGRHRPADAVGIASNVVHIATGEEEITALMDARVPKPRPRKAHGIAP